MLWMADGMGLPLATKSPSKVPDWLSFLLPELAAEEKYSAPAAVTWFTAWAIGPS